MKEYKLKNKFIFHQLTQLFLRFLMNSMGPKIKARAEKKRTKEYLI